MIKHGPKSGEKSASAFDKQKMEPKVSITQASRTAKVTVKGPLSSDFHKPAKVSHKPRAS